MRGELVLHDALARGALEVVYQHNETRILVGREALAELALGHRLAGRPNQLDIEPRRRLADGTDGAVVVVGRDARALGHAVAFADLHAEPLFEWLPDFTRAAAAPGDARAVRAVQRG